MRYGPRRTAISNLALLYIAIPRAPVPHLLYCPASSLLTFNWFFVYIHVPLRRMTSPCAPRSMLQEPTPELLSSSPPAPAAMAANRKPKRPPPITPKRFTRFFTPRNSKDGSSRTTLSSSGRQLQDITRAALNRSHATQRSTPRKTVNFADIENQMQTPQSSSRKRKNPYLSPESSPAQSSPSKRSRYVTPPPFEILGDLSRIEEPPVFPVPIRRLKALGGTSRTLQRSFGGLLSVGRGFRNDHCSSWQDQTADFYSGSDDLHQLPQGAPPFCTASCNSTLYILLLHFATVLTLDSELPPRGRRRRWLHTPSGLGGRLLQGSCIMESSLKCHYGCAFLIGRHVPCCRFR